MTSYVCMPTCDTALRLPDHLSTLSKYSIYAALLPVPTKTRKRVFLNSVGVPYLYFRLYF